MKIRGLKKQTLQENLRYIKDWFYKTCQDICGDLKYEPEFKYYLFNTLNKKSISIRAIMDVTFKGARNKANIKIFQALNKKISEGDVTIRWEWTPYDRPYHLSPPEFPLFFTYFDRWIYLDGSILEEHKVLLKRLESIYKQQSAWNTLRENNLQNLAEHPIVSTRHFKEMIKLFRKNKGGSFNSDKKKFKKKLLSYLELDDNVKFGIGD